MRHRKAGRKLSRTSAHRKALWSNMVASLLQVEQIRTTDAKAKELKRFAEPVISWATSVGDLLRKTEEKRTIEERAQIVHAIRMAKRIVKNQDALHRLFHEIVPRCAGRKGGFLRIVKVGHRIGDCAPMSIVELVDKRA